MERAKGYIISGWSYVYGQHPGGATIIGPFIYEDGGHREAHKQALLRAHIDTFGNSSHNYEIDEIKTGK